MTRRDLFAQDSDEMATINRHGEDVPEVQAAAAVEVASRYSDPARVGVYPSTGTVDLTIPAEAVPEGRCISVGPTDAPDGYEFEDASLHPNNTMHAVFVPEGER